MRKISYVVTFAAVLLILVINILSARFPDWLVARYDVLSAKVTIRYGLRERCERSVIKIPNPTNGNGWLEYEEHECRRFPLRVQDGCEDENRFFCAAWVSAQYFTELGIGFASMALVALLIGVSTHSRRRRVWRAVAGLVLIHTALQLVTFGLVTDLYRNNRFPAFEQARPGTGYVLNAISWVVGLFVGMGVIVTGVAADRGHKWAAGNRAYKPIRG